MQTCNEMNGHLVWSAVQGSYCEVKQTGLDLQLKPPGHTCIKLDLYDFTSKLFTGEYKEETWDLGAQVVQQEYSPYNWEVTEILIFPQLSEAKRAKLAILSFSHLSITETYSMPTVSKCKHVYVEDGGWRFSQRLLFSPTVISVHELTLCKTFSDNFIRQLY